MFLDGDDYWLGLMKVSATDVEWYDGTPLTYTEWRTGEPNEDGTACIYYSVTGWADRPCIALFYYTCKKHSLRPGCVHVSFVSSNQGLKWGRVSRVGDPALIYLPFICRVYTGSLVLILYSAITYGIFSSSIRTPRLLPVRPL